MNKDIHIFKQQTHSLSLNNSGTLNEQNLQFAKRTTLFDALRDYSNELVHHNQGYPQGDISEVVLTADFVILDSGTYSKILKLLSEFPKERTESISKYINIEIKA